MTRHFSKPGAAREGESVPGGGRLFPPLAGLSLAGLAIACAPPRVVPEPDCAIPGLASEPVDSANVHRLAGAYRIIMMPMASVDTTTRVFEVVLQATDSLERFPPRQVGRYPGERPLTGYYIDGPIVGLHPAGTKRPLAMIGEQIWIGDYDTLDGARFLLHPTRMGGVGFSGDWRWDGSFEVTFDSRGREITWGSSFCAIRIGPPGA